MDGYGKRILVVDDDEHARLLTAMVLERAGYNVVPARDGLEALSEVKKRHFDAVVTDFLMPMLNGQQLLGCIRAMHPKMPVILVSGAVPDSRGAGQEVPCYASLRKPFDGDVLLKLLHAAVASQEADRTKRASQPTVGSPALNPGNIFAGLAEAVHRACS